MRDPTRCIFLYLESHYFAAAKYCDLNFTPVAAAFAANGAVDVEGVGDAVL
jgi:hypothetical protein